MSCVSSKALQRQQMRKAIGSYKIDEKEHVVTHIVTQALLPNWVGSQQRRYYKFQDGKLILRTPPFTIGGKLVTGVLVWEKIKLQKE